MATLWYAQGAGAAESIAWRDGPSSGNLLVWPPATDDTLEANGYQIDGEGVASLEVAGIYNNNGGVFTFDMDSSDDEVMWVCDVASGSTECVTVEGGTNAFYLTGDAAAGTDHAVSHNGNGTMYHYGDATGGVGGGDHGIYGNSAGTVVNVGDLIGGSASNCCGYVNHYASSSMTNSGDCYGGSGETGYGCYIGNDSSIGELTGKLIFQDDKACPIGGLAPLMTLAATDYITILSIGGGTVKCAPEPDAGDIRDGVDVGSTTGTLELPAEEDVEDGVTYGEDGTEYEGTLAGGGGGRVPRLQMVC